MRPLLVVEVLEPVELGLQFGEGGGRWLLGEPLLQGLVEAFDLALGLRVAGVAVLLLDPQGGEQVFEGVAAAGEAGGVDRAVVGQGRGGWAVGVDVGGEGVHDIVAADSGERGERQQQPGVVIEPVDDLDVGAVGREASG